MAWRAQGTTPASVLNGTNTGINFSAFVHKQNIEASLTQFQAGKYACGTSTDYRNVIDFGHRDSFPGLLMQPISQQAPGFEDFIDCGVWVEFSPLHLLYVVAQLPILPNQPKQPPAKFPFQSSYEVLSPLELATL